MLRDVFGNCGDAPRKMTADNGYLSATNIELCDNNQIDAHIAVGREQNQDASTPSSSASEPTPASLARKRMRDKLQTREGKAVYARRKSIVEPALGQIKAARGFRRFSLRSFFKVRAEWTLVCLTPQPAQALPIEARDLRERLTRGSHLQIRIGTGTGNGTRTGLAVALRATRS